mgnify:CR=1 FL=1
MLSAMNVDICRFGVHEKEMEKEKTTRNEI